jgi:outer membrane protein assembly factor BamD
MLVATVTACPRELPRDLPADELYRIGVARFEDGRYKEAIEALQRLLLQDPGYPNADSAQFLVGESYFQQEQYLTYFQQEQYLTAANEFLRLAQSRPAGALADDARYKACLSYVELSPRPELDQEYTQDAINQCRSVVLLYPQSPFASDARARMAELTDKLARKSYMTAEYYFRRRAYDSAIIYLEHVLETYPGAEVEPEAMLRLYRSYQQVGYVQEAQRIRERLLSEYPDSPQAAELQERQANGAS